MTIKDTPGTKIEALSVSGGRSGEGRREIPSTVLTDPATIAPVAGQARTASGSAGAVTPKKSGKGGNVMETMDESSPLGRELAREVKRREKL